MRCAGVFLAKLDGSAKGGVVLSITQELNLPVLFVGTGEGPEDMAVFEPRKTSWRACSSQLKAGHVSALRKLTSTAQ